MEYILYVLLLISLDTNGGINIYQPIPYITETECEFNKNRVLNLMKPDTVVAPRAACVKITFPHVGESI